MSYDYPAPNKPTSIPVKYEKKYDWITDICQNVACRDGYMSAEIKGYTTAFNCPICNQWEIETEPGHVICASSGRSSCPRLAIYKGPITLYSDDEMKDMIAFRRDVYFASRRGLEETTP
jgi:hypothetical protein